MYYIENADGAGKVASNEKELITFAEAGYLPPGFTPEAVKELKSWIESHGGNYEKILALAEKFHPKEPPKKK